MICVTSAKLVRQVELDPNRSEQGCLQGTWIKANRIDWLRKAAEQGHAESQYRLANFYHRGRVAERDGQKALFWFRKAASQGYAKALAIGQAIYGPHFMTLKPEPSVDWPSDDARTS